MKRDLDERCPSCDSPDPARHPAMQWEGEVQPCGDPWHDPLPPDIAALATPPHRAALDAAGADTEPIVCFRCHEGRHDLCQMGACTCCGLDAAGADTGHEGTT